jgi:hypothetical protein
MAGPPRTDRFRHAFVHHRLAGRASAAPGSALKQTSSLDHAGEPTDAPRSSSSCGISDIERLHP